MENEPIIARLISWDLACLETRMLRHWPKSPEQRIARNLPARTTYRRTETRTTVSVVREPHLRFLYLEANMRCTQDMGFGSNNPLSQEEMNYMTQHPYSRRGMFDEIPLFEYAFNNTPIYQEFVQFTPWSSGPMEHCAIRRVSDGKLFNFWKEDEVSYE